jgi:hypothetical protein
MGKSHKVFEHSKDLPAQTPMQLLEAGSLTRDGFEAAVKWYRKHHDPSYLMNEDIPSGIVNPDDLPF